MADQQQQPEGPDQAQLDALDSAFAKSAVDRKYITYRGIDPKIEERLAQLRQGDTITPKVYLSVTTLLREANGYGTNLMRIVLNPGARAINMSPTSGIPGHVLLDRNQDLVFDGVGKAGEYQFHVGGNGK